MRTSIALAFIVLGLVACEPPAPKHKPEKYVAHKHVADLTMTLPAGFDAHYNAITDSWRFASPDTTVVFERTPEASTAGPDAFRQYLGIKAELVKRQGINDGFIATFEDGEVYVVRQIYNHDWFRCVSPVASDDIVALCKSLKRPRRT